MRQIKSERLKKLEQELNDLEQWLKLGLVPKKDIDRHQDEIVQVQTRISEEKERLQFLKESGEVEDYVAPKRQATRTAYTDMPTLPDIDADAGSGAGGNTVDTSYDGDSETAEGDLTRTTATVAVGDDVDATFVDEDEESIFSDKNRWRRGAKDIIDPDANEW